MKATVEARGPRAPKRPGLYRGLVSGTVYLNTLDGHLIHLTGGNIGFKEPSLTINSPNIGPFEGVLRLENE